MSRSEGISSLRDTGYAIDRVDWKDPLSYVREMYGVPAKVGGRVRFNGEPGVIIGGHGQYVEVKLDEGEREPFLLHPAWRMEYLDA